MRSVCLALSAVACVVVLAGCGASGPDGVAETPTRKASESTAPTSGSPPSASTSSQSPKAPVVRVAIRDGKVNPRPSTHRVARGETVRLVVSTDRADELHVHGYEKTARLPAGESTTVTLRADRPGRFEVETHDTGLRLLVVEVR